MGLHVLDSGTRIALKLLKLKYQVVLLIPNDMSDNATVAGFLGT